MAHDLNSKLWPVEGEHYFHEMEINQLTQLGTTCVSTSLAMLTGKTTEYFLGLNELNTQDPYTWSEALKKFGMKLAYCPTDVRKLKFYMEELIGYDDLFLVSFYSLNIEQEMILGDPDEKGWLCGSHVVILHKDLIYDPMKGNPVKASEHSCMEAHTKRIFRVVPVEHKRGL